MWGCDEFKRWCSFRNKHPKHHYMMWDTYTHIHTRTSKLYVLACCKLFFISFFSLSLITKWKWIQVSYQLSFACLPEYKKKYTNAQDAMTAAMAGRQAGMSYMHTNKQIYRMERKCLNLKFLCVCVFVYDSMLNTHGIFFGCYGCIWMDKKKKYKKCMFGNYRKLYSSSKNKNKKKISQQPFSMVYSFSMDNVDYCYLDPWPNSSIQFLLLFFFFVRVCVCMSIRSCLKKLSCYLNSKRMKQNKKHTHAKSFYFFFCSLPSYGILHSTFACNNDHTHTHTTHRIGHVISFDSHLKSGH